MQALKLANDLFPGLRDGSKQCTIRAGRRDIQIGPLLFESTDLVDGESLKQEVFVTEIRYTFLGLITDEIAQMDGCPTADELESVMHRFYPDLSLGDVVTVIIFEIPRGQYAY